MDHKVSFFIFQIKMENEKIYCKNPCVESIIQKIIFLKNENCIFLRFSKIWKILEN